MRAVSTHFVILLSFSFRYYHQFIHHSSTRHLKTAVAEVGKRGRVLHIAHSQGALVTALAAKQLTPLEMNQIEILAFGGAAALRKTPETPFSRCINYYS